MRNKLMLILLTIFVMLIAPNVCSAEVIEVSNASELSTAFSNGGDIKLANNINATSNLQSSNNSVVLDLNGKTLNMGSYVLVALKPLTIKDTSSISEGKLKGTANFVVQIGNTNKTGLFTLESGTVEGSKYGIRNYIGSSLIINGGKVDAPSFTIYNQGIFTLNDGYIHASNGLGLQNHQNTEFTMNGGKIQTDGDNSAINLYGDCKATINNGEIHAHYIADDDNGGMAISMFKNTELIINGGLLSAYSFGIYQNGSLSGSNAGFNAKVTITGGTINSTVSTGIYASSANGETTITGGTINGKTGIEVRAGKLTVSGATVTGNTSGYSLKSNANGATTDGAAISIAQHDTLQPIDVLINGGTYNAAVPISFSNPLGNAEEHINKINVTVNGGTFRASSNDAVISYNDKKILAGGTYNKDVTKYVLDGFGIREASGNEYVVGKEYTLTVNSDSSENITIDKTKAFGNDTITVSPKDKWNYMPIIKVIDSNNNLIEVTNNKFVMPNSDVTISIDYDLRYKIISGDNQEFKNSNITIKTNGDLNKLVSIKIDDQELSESNYTLTSGSTILQIKKSYLKKLSTGTHEITFNYNDGFVSTSLIVNGKNPPTNDNIKTYFILFIVGAISLTCIYNKYKKRIN